MVRSTYGNIHGLMVATTYRTSCPVVKASHCSANDVARQVRVLKVVHPRGDMLSCHAERR